MAEQKISAQAMLTEAFNRNFASGLKPPARKVRERRCRLCSKFFFPKSKEQYECVECLPK
jgi:hypothetical protein